MASTTTTTTTTTTNPNGFDPSSPSSSTPNTTFVQADPSNFRTIVQKLTGASEDPSSQKLPLTTNMGPRKSPFKLHERRQAMKKLDLINLHTHHHHHNTSSNTHLSPSFINRPQRGFVKNGYGGGEMLLVSPVSTLDHLFVRGSSTSPRTPKSPEEEEEERAIAEKGFYFHPSPLSTPRESEPELLPLFPLHSPSADIAHHSSS